jgi:hypothetical protein
MDVSKAHGLSRARKRNEGSECFAVLYRLDGTQTPTWFDDFESAYRPVGGSHGILMTCPGTIRLGLVICGLAASSAPSVTPKNCSAMPLRLSPGWTV